MHSSYHSLTLPILQMGKPKPREGQRCAYGANLEEMEQAQEARQGQGEDRGNKADDGGGGGGDAHIP